MTTRRKRMNHAQWRGHVEAQAQSGLSLEAYCQSHDLGPASFRYHQGRMRRENAEAAPPGGFAELRPASSGLKLLDPRGAWMLELESDFHAATLRRFLAAVAP